MTRFLSILAFLLVASVAVAQEKPPAVASEADELQLQIVILKSQLAQALAAGSKCEAEGPQSAKMATDAQTGAQSLIKSLDARGLMIDQQTNKIVAKPVEPKPTPAEKPKG